MARVCNRLSCLYIAIDIVHLGEESYGNMWQKVRSIWKYVYKHYTTSEKFDEKLLQTNSEFDYYLLGGDDLYVMVENLIGFLRYKLVVLIAFYYYILF